jgi:hypothetical protein
MKKWMPWGVVCFLFGALFVGCSANNNPAVQEIPEEGATLSASRIQATWAFDIHDMPTLAGYSDYIFVGTVGGLDHTRYREQQGPGLHHPLPQAPDPPHHRQAGL